MENGRKPPYLWMALPILALVAWSTIYWFVCDDAYISFRYARNLLRGDGLVFNVGEYVEGYTNFLWVLELAGIWALTGIRPEYAAPVLSEVLTVGTGVVIAAMALRSPVQSPWARWTAPLAVLLFATNRSVAVWATSGLEVRQFTFFLTLGLYALSRWRDGDRWLVWGSLSLAAATLTRPEGMLLGPILLLWAGLDHWRLGRVTLRAALSAALPFMLIIGAHLLWRHAYYGEWLPNTYYAKSVRPWWDAGGMFLAVAAIEHALYLLLPLALVGAVARYKQGDSVHFAMWAWAIPNFVHLASIGGDHFEFRMFDELWPPLALAVADGVVYLAGVSGRRLVFGAVVAVAYQLGMPIAHDLQAFQRNNREQTIHMKVTISTENAPWLWLMPPVPFLLDTYTRWDHWLHDHSIAARQREHLIFSHIVLTWYEPFRAWEDEDIFPRDAVAAESALGGISYFLPGLTIIDEKGLTDATVARNPVTRPNDQRQIAHDRSPPPGYLEERGVNMEVQALMPTAQKALKHAEFAVRLGDEAWMAVDSSKPTLLRQLFEGRQIQARDPAPLHRPISERFTHKGATYAVKRTLGAFDADMSGWTVEGQAFASQPAHGAAKRQQVVSGFEGEGLVNTFDAALIDSAQGVARSPDFVPAAGESLTFLVGGGKERVGVVLVGPAGEIGRWSGKNEEDLFRVVVPLAPYVGQTVHVELRDDSDGYYGHLLADAVAIAAIAP